MTVGERLEKLGLEQEEGEPGYHLYLDEDSYYMLALDPQNESVSVIEESTPVRFSVLEANASGGYDAIFVMDFPTAADFLKYAVVPED